MPYRAPTYFGQTLPSSSLDSFLRDSAGSEDFGRYTAGYNPYYSPTRTVTTVVPGYSNVTRPLLINTGGYAAQPRIVWTLPPRRDALLDPAAAMSLSRLRPMSMTPGEMEKLISSEIAQYSPAGLTDRQYQPQVEQYKPDANQVSDKTAELTKIPTGLDNYLLPSAAKKLNVNLPVVPQRFETPTQKKQAEETTETPFDMPGPPDWYKQLDVYEQMKQQLDKLQKDIELALAKQQPEIAAEDGNKPAKEQTQEGSLTEKLAEIDLSVARAKSILGPFETFASFSEDRFNQHMRVAEQYLKQGKYYRAADAYTLASIYKPDDPLAYAGKSHALFASGEYMSSALFLSRALQIFPEYARFKIDIEAMVGDRDKLETRIVDVEEWLSRSGAPELQFLLAYVYYQIDRLQPAKEAIDAACETMPEAPAVLALKKAIDDSIQRTADDAEPVLPRKPSLGAKWGARRRRKSKRLVLSRFILSGVEESKEKNYSLYVVPVRYFYALSMIRANTSLDIQKVFGPGGVIAQSFAGFENRPQQVQMASAIKDAFADRRHLVTEAGTGIGKSFAYLIPAIELFHRKETKVLISTFTITLQEQLINKDIPFLAAALPQTFTAVLAKGRGNYLCRRRLEFALRRQADDV